MSVAAGFFFGLSNLTVRQGQLQGKYDRLHGLFIGILINKIINVVVILFMLLFRVHFPPLNLNAVLYFVLGGILTTFLGRVLLFGSIELIGPSRAGAFKVAAPVFTVLLGVSLLNERFDLPVWIGVLLVLLGALLCSSEQSLHYEYSNVTKVSKLSVKWGFVLALLAALSLGTGNVYRKLGLIHYGIPVVGIAISSMVALLIMVIYFAWQNKLLTVVQDIPEMLKGGGYVWTGILTSLALYATFTALLYTPVSIVNTIKSAEPLFTIMGSYFLYKNIERLSLRLVVVSVVIVVGIALITVFS